MEPTTGAFIGVAELKAQGFTGEQITRLRQLRSEYPLREIVDSQQTLDRLRFLKWSYATGRVDA
jgi:hypothetical protein